MKGLRTGLLLALVFGGALLGTAWWTGSASGTDLWGHLEPAKAATENEYCEFNRMDFPVRQPVNAWSNFAYLAFGLMALYRVGPPRSPLLKAFPLWPWWVATTFAFLCFSSFYFHASLSREGQHWDMTATYALVNVLGLGAVYRLGLGRWWSGSWRSQGLALGMLVGVDLLFFLFKWSLDGKVVLPAMFTVVIGILLWLWGRNPGHFSLWKGLLALLAMVVAGALLFLDRAKVGCDPQSMLQGHALWHLLTGTSGFVAYRFLADENP